MEMVVKINLGGTTMSMDITGMSAMLNQTSANHAASSKAEGLKGSVNGLSSSSTDEELMEVLKDFESYFVEQMIKKMKETFTDEDEEESSMASQYTDTFMDYAIEGVADKILDEVGGSMTQQLFEQMKRNYNIPTAE